VLRKLVTAVSVAVVAGAAFVTASWAMSASSTSRPDLPPWLTATALPTVAVPDAAQVAINNLISTDDASRYGITAESFSNARVLTQTDLGPLYVIPGTSGLCLAVSTPVVTCTDDLSRSGPAVIALLAPNSEGTLVGGGLVAAAGNRISVREGDGSLVATHPTVGGFAVTANDHVTAVPKEQISLVGN
jgi:hypothetical protein